jgi:hypothetical protein
MRTLRLPPGAGAGGTAGPAALQQADEVSPGRLLAEAAASVPAEADHMDSVAAVTSLAALLQPTTPRPTLRSSSRPGTRSSRATSCSTFASWAAWTRRARTVRWRSFARRCTVECGGAAAVHVHARQPPLRAALLLRHAHTLAKPYPLPPPPPASFMLHDCPCDAAGVRTLVLTQREVAQGQMARFNYPRGRDFFCELQRQGDRARRASLWLWERVWRRCCTGCAANYRRMLHAASAACC